MFNVGGGELIVIALIALIVLGPQRLPGAARQVGKAMGDLRRLSQGFQNEVRSAIQVADDPDQVAARRNVLAREAPRTPADADIGPSSSDVPDLGLATAPLPPPGPRPSAQERLAAAQAASTASSVEPAPAAAKPKAARTKGSTAGKKPASKTTSTKNGTSVGKAPAKKATAKNGAAAKKAGAKSAARSTRP